MDAFHRIDFPPMPRVRQGTRLSGMGTGGRPSGDHPRTPVIEH